MCVGGEMMGQLIAPLGSGEARVRARYWIEMARALEWAAEVLAGEQSAVTFIRVAGATDG